MHSAVVTQNSVCLSVCDALQVGLPVRYHAHIGWIWNSSKIISRLNSLRLMRWLIPNGPTCAIWCNGNTPKLRQNRGGGQEHIKAVISPKWCMIGARLLLRTNRKSHTRFRLAPKSIISDDLERPKRHSCRNKQNFRSLNSFRMKIRAKYSGRKREQN